MPPCAVRHPHSSKTSAMQRSNKLIRAESHWLDEAPTPKSRAEVNFAKGSKENHCKMEADRHPIHVSDWRHGYRDCPDQQQYATACPCLARAGCMRSFPALANLLFSSRMHIPGQLNRSDNCISTSVARSFRPVLAQRCLRWDCLPDSARAGRKTASLKLIKFWLSCALVRPRPLASPKPTPLTGTSHPIVP